MKHIARFLLLVMILSLCISMTGCTGLFKPKWFAICPSFYVSIETAKGDDGLDFEIARKYSLEFTPIFGNVDEELYDQISIELNNENMAISAPRKKYTYVKSKLKTIEYDLYAYEFAQDDTLKITYNGETIEIKYDVNDYDFESTNWVTPTSIDDLDKYPEFKEMILSLEYYEFKEPYIGLNKWDYDVRRDNMIWFDYSREDYENKYMELDYLKYLTDSVYYPSKFIGFDMYMGLYEGTDISQGASRSKMNTVNIYLAVSDPHHNKRSDSITGMNFIIYDIESVSRSPMLLLLERYPEEYFQYQIDGITIYILSTEDSGAEAYFTHGDYFYRMVAGYDFD